MIQAIDIARENDTLRNILLGQPQACQRVERQIRYIVRISYRSFSQDEVNDVVQNVLLNLYSLVSKPEFRLERSLNALIRRITLARCTDLFRRRRPTIDPGRADQCQSIAPGTP